ncbi:glycosyltransferase family A protein [Microbacterium yannicii]|uniref:glycosyltransferase family A protein n=1 Tax=Microbacterium yannicii TaxID=671622 RepID=UPI0002E80089|nr:glycosyltransferase family 2 protein [Microbacterium yannicii]
MPRDAAAIPTVSIVVRTRNRPTLLAEALRDIASQDYTDFEVVLVNDGDDTRTVEEAVTAVPAIADRVRIIDRTNLEHGRARAANAGVRAARGELLVLHDDDDTWATDFLSVTVDHLRRHPDAQAVSAHTEVIIHRTDPATGEERLEHLLLNPSLTAISIMDMVRENRVTTHSLLYRAAVHEEIGFLDEDLVAHEDWDFYLRFIVRYPIDLIPLPARAFWHHRPEAIGDEGNSVFVLDADHDAGRVRVQDNHLRTSIARIGLGPALHLAAETKALEADLRAQQEAVFDLRERLERLERQVNALPATLEQIQTGVAQIAPLVLERTSIGSLFRRAGRMLRR